MNDIELEKAAVDYKTQDMAKGNGLYYNSGRIPAFKAGAAFQLDRASEVWIVEFRSYYTGEWQPVAIGTTEEIAAEEQAERIKLYQNDDQNYRIRPGKLFMGNQ